MDSQPNEFHPEFLTLEAVLEIHGREIEEYGGSPEIRDVALLESAIAQPQAGVGDRYLHSGIHEMAAAYLYHITRNHPFVDGNKRTAAVAANVFLLINGETFDPNDNEFVDLVYAIARGEKSKAQAAQFIKENSRRQATD